MSKFRNTIGSWRWWLGLQPAVTLGTPPRMTITAIIPAFNEAEHIASTIRSLQTQTYPLSKIIVIDDCSTDGTGNIAEECEVTVLRTPENKGTKSQAQNYALAYVDTELFVTVDADTVLAPTAIEEAMRFFNDAKTTVVCGTVIPQRRTNFWERGRLVEYLYSQAIMKTAQNHHGLVLVASGCFSIFRTATVVENGGFAERTLAEDMDLTWEIQNQGGRVYFAPRAICYPVDPPTATIYVKQLDRWYRGFMQNMKVRRFRVFPQKPLMAMMVYGYLVWFAVSAFLLPVLFFLATHDLLATLLVMFAVDSVFVWMPALYMARRYGVWRDALWGLLPFIVLPYINLVIYLRAALLELVFGRTLQTWQKGH